MTYDGTRYFVLGRSPVGQTHAVISMYGRALCDAPLARVDDSRRYTEDEVYLLDICPTCRVVARIAA